MSYSLIIFGHTKESKDNPKGDYSQTISLKIYDLIKKSKNVKMFGQYCVLLDNTKDLPLLANIINYGKEFDVPVNIAILQEYPDFWESHV